ncbi:winged helix DNA-binding domain-containing protein [candidate division WWE3 bacterium]|nr:winged helix DNA-binding domain-containing protein [candidate division WWE3 bacterium]
MKLDWQRINSWRLYKHGLLATSNNSFDVVSKVIGLQSQVLSAAELSLFVRMTSLKRNSFHTALKKDHTLIKTWMMRGTLHLTTPDIYQLFVSARKVNLLRWYRYFEYYGISEKDFELYIESANEVLSDTPTTREELARRLAEVNRNKNIKELITSKSWGSPLKPLAWAGYLSFGANQSQNVTFINPRFYIKNWKESDPIMALQEIIRKYLQVYGPSNVKQFTNWWDGGSGLTYNKKVFDTLSDELAEVTIGDWRGVILESMKSELVDYQMNDHCLLLPLFDAFTIGLERGSDLFQTLAKKFHKFVFRPQGWISAVIVINGSIQGVWEYKIQSGKLIVKIQGFSTFSLSTKNDISNRVNDFAEYLSCKPEITF